MVSIPSDLRALCEGNRAKWRREDRAALDRVLTVLDIPAESEFGQLLDAYTLQFFAPAPRDELADPVDSDGAPNSAIRWAWECWEVPERYVAISSLEGEGGYFYDRETGSVADFELGRGTFLLFPGGFFDFLRWYLSEAADWPS